ncbi:DUF2799 domain-containing protein [Agarilytica rhodophyticola]|uniref:DUF2799 domain-containing protein n=1 Tax=Agarilytica rhodophyticola TaxID=1737490 RepID=UPI000B346C8B|nr:DUF2799 domain-containing protein [Agarilytica rhodophyticola]
MLRLLALSFLCLLLSACATMNKSECLSADWQAIGYEDGAKGHTINKLSDRREACAKHGVTPQLQAYRTGRSDGLKEFCSEYSGFQQGSSGYNYQGVCRDFNEQAFLDGYHDGKHLYALNKERNKIKSRIEHNRHEIKRLDKRVLHLRDEIASETSTPQQRTEALDEIIAIEHDIDELLLLVDEDLELSIAAEREYQDFKRSLDY